MRTFKLFNVILLVVLLVSVSACGGAAGKPDVCNKDSFGCAVIKPGETIKIGMGAPLTGDYADFGIDISQGAKLAIQDGGELQGFKFELVAEDDGGSSEGGATVANKFVTDPTIVAIAGHIFSGATEAAMVIYEKYGIPMLSPSATNPPLTEKGSKVFNRVAFTDAMQAKAAAEYLYNKLGIKDLAIMHDGSTYGKGIAEAVQADFTALGGKVVGFEAVTPGEEDYSSPLAAIGAAKPQAIYFGGYNKEGVVIVNQMKVAGLEGAIFFGDDGTFGSDFLTRTGANGEGAYSTSFVLPVSDAKTNFDAAYLAAYGVESGKLSPFTWNAYDSAAALVSLIKSVAVKGSDNNLYIPRSALVNAVRTLKDYKGITGNITCSDVGECSAAQPTFYVIKDGKWVEAP